MGIFDRHGRNTRGGSGPEGKQVARADRADVTGSAARVVQRLLDAGIDGKGPFDPADKIATLAIAGHADRERAIDAIVRAHLRMGAAGGFVTGVGGFITLPVALPANVLEFYLVATRMVAAIAAARGYDISRPELRSAVLLTLVGADADDLLKKAGYAASGRLASLATAPLPAPVLMAVNKGVGFRVLTQAGRRSLTRFGKAVPVVGGAVGAGLDTYLLKRIADHARREFPPVGSGS